VPRTWYVPQSVEHVAAMVEGDANDLSYAVSIEKLLGRKGMVEFPGAQEVVELRSACDADLRTDWVEFLVRWHRYTA